MTMKAIREVFERFKGEYWRGSNVEKGAVLDTVCETTNRDFGEPWSESHVLPLFQRSIHPVLSWAPETGLSPKKTIDLEG